MKYNSLKIARFTYFEYMESTKFSHKPIKFLRHYGES